MTTIDVTSMTAEEILETYAHGKEWPYWSSRHIDFTTGLATAELHSSFNGFRGLWNVNVHVDHRGKGEGRRLMDIIVAYAEATSTGLKLSVYADNEPAIRLYRSVGFAITHTMHGEGLVYGMRRYPTRIPSTPEWSAHFESLARILEA